MGLQAGAAADAAARDELRAALRAAQTQAYNRGVEVQEERARLARTEEGMARYAAERHEEAVAALMGQFRQAMAVANQVYQRDVNILQAAAEDAARMGMHHAENLHMALHNALMDAHIAQGQRDALGQALWEALHRMHEMRGQMARMQDPAQIADAVAGANRLQEMAMVVVRAYRELQEMPDDMRAHFRDLLMQAMRQATPPPARPRPALEGPAAAVVAALPGTPQPATPQMPGTPAQPSELPTPATLRDEAMEDVTDEERARSRSPVGRGKAHEAAEKWFRDNGEPARADELHEGVEDREGAAVRERQRHGVRRVGHAGLLGVVDLDVAGRGGKRR